LITPAFYARKRVSVCDTAISPHSDLGDDYHSYEYDDEDVEDNEILYTENNSTTENYEIDDKVFFNIQSDPEHYDAK
jgi:hypothetical protein